MIQVNHVNKSFDGFQALNDLSLHVEKGSVYGLVGPNGAGKSTFIRHLTGVYKQDSGEIFIDGQSAYENPLVKRKIASIPDSIFFFNQSNLKDLMKMYKGVYPDFDEDKFYKLLPAFPELDLKKNLRSMSKGMQKQTAFLLSIAANPEILVLDEPIDGLDPVMRRQVWSILLADVEEKQTTVLISSHNLRELEDVCDHVGILNHGKLILERSLSDLQSSTVKVQIAYEGERPVILPEGMELLHESRTGRVYSFILRGDIDVIQEKLMATNPLLLDILPLTLEEIFIYELGGADYAVKDILI